jgi:hypothetical protein
MTTTEKQQQDTKQPTHDLTEGGAPPQVDAGDEARGVLAKARFDAFQVVTEARKEAESILEEAREEAAEIVTAAKMQAESIVDAAHLGADEVRTNAAATPDPPTTDGSSAALEAEHDELVARVTSLRSIADQVEERFAALAAGANTRTVVEAATAPILDYSPSVARASSEVADEPAADAPAAPAEKGSFYNRRSANLPSIGDDGGRSALDMMRSIRGTFDDKA